MLTMDKLSDAFVGAAKSPKLADYYTSRAASLFLAAANRSTSERSALKFGADVFELVYLAAKHSFRFDAKRTSGRTIERATSGICASGRHSVPTKRLLMTVITSLRHNKDPSDSI